MKKILVLTTLLTDDIYNTYQEALKLASEDVLVISPIVLLKDSERKSLNYEKIFMSFKLLKGIVEFAEKNQKKTLVYVGPSFYDIVFDKIVSLKGLMVDLEEIQLSKTLDFFPPTYRSSSAELDFPILEQLLDFLKKELEDGLI